MNIGFQSLVFITEESDGNSTRTRVCAQIDNGTLEREVTAFLSTIAGGTATGMHYYCYYGILIKMGSDCSSIHKHST